LKNCAKLEIIFLFFQDSAYFLGSTVTTIGFGDILPEVRFIPFRYVLRRNREDHTFLAVVVLGSERFAPRHLSANFLESH
jgi:hypothetical protein